MTTEPAAYRITATDMHTGGEPFRIVESGYPSVLGATLLDKRRYVQAELDHLRTALLHEPRGHFDMYGVVLVEPDLPEADLAALFMHNSGYSTMCGHGVIALGRYAVDQSLVSKQEPLTRLVIQCPCGPVAVQVEVEDGRTGAVSFRSVPAFAPYPDLKVQVKGYGRVSCGVAYGGAFYAISDAAEFGLDVRRSPVAELVRAANALSETVKTRIDLTPHSPAGLGFLYGSILTDGKDGDSVSVNVCVFADSQVDRSPTGSGVTARMALRHALGQVEVGEERIFESVIGSVMTGCVVEELDLDNGDRGVGVEVGGHAYYSSKATFVIEPDDPFRHGFLVR